MNDRLQTIKECDLVDVIISIYESKSANLKAVIDDVNWLIEQADKVERYEKALKAYGDEEGKLMLKDLEEMEKFLKNQEVKSRLAPKYREHILSSIHWDEE